MQHPGWDGGGALFTGTLPAWSQQACHPHRMGEWGALRAAPTPPPPNPIKCHHVDRGSPSFEVGPQSTLTRQARAHGACLLCPTPLSCVAAPLWRLAVRAHAPASWPGLALPPVCRQLAAGQMAHPPPHASILSVSRAPCGQRVEPEVGSGGPHCSQGEWSHTQKRCLSPPKPARHSYTTRLPRSPGYGLAGVSCCGFSRARCFMSLLMAHLLRLPRRVLFVEDFWPF